MSISTPLQKSEDIQPYQRPRRHTITRPDSAMALLSDLEDLEDEDEEQQQTFDRISGILSNLIQEANEAVNGIEQERAHLLKSKQNDRLFTSSTIITTKRQDTSKIPRPRRSHHSITPSHSRNSSSSTTSSSTLVNSPTNMCRSASPTMLNFRRHPNSVRVLPTRRSITPKRTNNNNSKNMDPIIESYKRLDSSMALVESLSRDLATPKNGNNNQPHQQGLDTRLTILLLIPLLHIPHSLITMVFDFFLNHNTNNSSSLSSNKSSSSSTFNFTTMIFWACVFTVTNLMVDQAVIPNTKQYFIQKVRRMSLPGSYKNNTTVTIPTASTVPVKRTWIPTTIQKQYQFRLGEDTPPVPQKRRNSI